MTFDGSVLILLNPLLDLLQIALDGHHRWPCPPSSSLAGSSGATGLRITKRRYE